MDRIQSLMEELGPGTSMHFGSGDSCFTQARYCAHAKGYHFDANDPIEALTKLRDKVKPRTPEDIVNDFLKHSHTAYDVSSRASFARAAVSALRDAGFLREET